MIRNRDLHKTYHTIIIFLLSMGLIIGFLLAINMLRLEKGWFSEIFVSEIALFFAIGFLSLGVLLYKKLSRDCYRFIKVIIRTLTIAIFLLCLLPFVFIPVLLKNAKDSYETAFIRNGNESASIPISESDFYRNSAFLLPEYFLGTASKPYQVEENILFYEGSEGVDEGLKLHFDVYTPTAKKQLPGGNSVLIRIHGGGWTMGDKGMFNFTQMNKYFAAQGYVVFDIQYGLSNQEQLFDFVPVKESRKGDFTIDDMVRHIGIFIKFLADHKEDYNANTDSVFISGGSAGGQLALAVGLGVSSGNYQDILDNRIIVKGLIPFYPAVDLSRSMNIGGQESLVNPSLLVKKESPPCLIYQGNHDGLVDLSVSEKFQRAYIEAGNNECAMIKMPFGGHASDFYFSGYYNQVFLYYMERFMYQYR
ncbi:alpha/beta hydrolase [Mobilitalea sibirica]|uniref:Alpha/beta hydrolase n=1 Tax=Mobilitalea sibirica TaxID=1462919 RepID=A0A8J7H3P5_9FIRM|nr:alpha/beta hydrolase [Mobilitalea sibirica]MBH1941792.1 alpha/beta hydrolase [Mobilitalea sibirica]